MIYARGVGGVRDLYYGIPDLDGAIVIKTATEKKDGDVHVTLTLRTKAGVHFDTHLVQEDK